MILKVADYFTSYLFPPVRHIAEASQTGAATNFLAGFSTGLQSTAPSAVVLVVALLISYYLGYYGSGGDTLIGVYTHRHSDDVHALAHRRHHVDRLLRPDHDNANGIAEMAGLEGNVRTVTDELDAIGNTTKATTKAFAVMSAALAAVSIFEAFQSEVNRQIALHNLFSKYGLAPGGTLSFTLSDPHVIIGLFIGSLLPVLLLELPHPGRGPRRDKDGQRGEAAVPEIPGSWKGRGSPTMQSAWTSARRRPSGS